MRIECVHPNELGRSELDAWSRVRAANPGLSSPYFAAGFACAVGAARADARVAVIEDGGAIQGFFAVQRPSPFTAMALGAPISDYQGVISAAPMALEASALCRALKVGRIDLCAVDLGSQTDLLATLRGECDAFYAKLGPGGSAAFLADLKSVRCDTIKKMDRKRRAMAKAHGDVTFTANDPSSDNFERLMTWTRQRCRLKRQPPVWETAWVTRVIERIRSNNDPDFRALLFTDTAGDQLAAAQLVLQSGRILHTWIIGHDQAFDAFSPGMALTRKVIEWAADNGFEEVDLGLGDYRFKRQLTNAERKIGSGFIGRQSWSTLVRRSEFAVRGAMEKAPLSLVRRLPGKAMRRLDVYRALGLSPPRAPA